MLETQRELIERARSVLQIKDNSHMNSDTFKRTEFAINSYVLVQYENSEHRPPTKLDTRWRGPLQVVSREGDIYTLLNLVNNKLEDFHIKNIKQFYYDPIHTDPRIVANKDYKFFDVEAILKHRGKINRSSMEFLVKWTGYNETTWEPYKNVRDNIILHNYLKANKKLLSLLPQKFKV